MEAIRRQLAETLSRATNPALLLSFGKDSLLLLRLARGVGFRGPCYYFGDDLSALAASIVVDNDLTVYSWPATNRYVIPDGDRFAQVDEYLMGNVLLPTVSPIVAGTNCDNHKIPQRFTSPFYFPHDVTLWGYRKSDSCEAIRTTFAREFSIGPTTLNAPLYDLSGNDVYAACETLGIEYEDSNEVQFCDACLNAILNDDWNKSAALAGFHERFKLNH